MHLNFLRPPEWMDDALCAGMIDDDTWFATSGINSAAKQTCAICPSRIPCLDYALANNAEGIWGGTSHDQRKKLARDGAA